MNPYVARSNTGKLGMLPWKVEREDQFGEPVCYCMWESQAVWIAELLNAAEQAGGKE